MANKKLNQLVTKPSIASGDLFPIADATTGQLYKTTISDLGTAIGSGVSSVNGLVGAVVLDTDDIQELASPVNKWFTDLRARAALSAGTGISYSSSTGVIASTITQYTDALARGAISLTTTGSNGSASYNSTTGVLNVPAYTLSGLGGQPLAGNLTALAGLSYSSLGFIKMTGVGTLALDTTIYVSGSGTTNYLPKWSSSGVLTDSAISYNGNKTTVEASGLVSLNGLELQGNYNTVNGLKLLSSDSTTGYSYMEFTNTGGGFRLGVNRNTSGGILSGSATYATFITTIGATSLQLGANGAMILSLNTSGLARFSNQVIVDNTLTATQFIRSGGTSDQFLKADGSVDSNTYLTTSSASSTYLAKTGGTLTGALSGTSATFNGTGYSIFQGSAYLQTPASTGLSFGYNRSGGNGESTIVYGAPASGFNFEIASVTSGTITPRLTLASSGAATFSSSVTAQAIYATDATGSAILTTNGGGEGVLSVNTANPLRVLINGGEKLRVTSSGNVGIGTTSPNRNLEVATGSDTYLRVTGNRGNADGVHVGNIEFYNSNTTRLVGEIRGITGTGGTQSNSGQLAFYTNNAGTYDERMRITSGGNLLVGTTTDPGFKATFDGGSSYTMNINQSAGTGTNIALNVRHNATTGTIRLVNFVSGSTDVGSITTNGTITAYNVSSDYRLKEDLKPINGLDLVNKIKIYDYKYKSSSMRMDGVLAHELQEILPYAVSGVKDGEQMQQVDYSKIVPVMVQAIKDLKAELDILKNK